MVVKEGQVFHWVIFLNLFHVTLYFFFSWMTFIFIKIEQILIKINVQFHVIL